MHAQVTVGKQIVINNSFFQPYSEKMKNTTDEDKKNMYLRIIVSVHYPYCCNLSLF